MKKMIIIFLTLILILPTSISFNSISNSNKADNSQNMPLDNNQSSTVRSRELYYNDDFHNIFNKNFNYDSTNPNLYYIGPIYINEGIAPTYADLDNDGDLDLTMGEYDGILHYYENIGDSMNPTWKENSTFFNGIDIGTYSIPSFADLDNDNDLDLTIGASDGTLYYYENIGNSNFPVWSFNVNAFSGIDVGWACSPAIKDLDSDNDLDLTLGAHDGTLYYYNNTGNNQNPIWTLETSMFIGIDVGDHSTPNFADLDGDNDFDLSVGSEDGKVFYYKNTGTQSNPTWTLDGLMFAGIYISTILSKPVFSDIDGDNDLDLTLAMGREGISYFYYNTGTINSPIWTPDDTIFFSICVNYRSKPAFIDLNNDGDLDLTIGGDIGKLSYWENTGNATNPSWSEDTTMYTNIPSGSNYAPTFADIDADGDFDLTLGNHGENLKYYNNTGDAQNPIWSLDSNMFSGISVKPFMVPTYSDLNDDGDFDLVIGDQNGLLHYYENIGNSKNPIWNLNNSMFPGIDVGSWCKPTFVDMDYDHDSDLVIGRDSGNLTYYENIGDKTLPVWKNNPEIFKGIKIKSESAPAFADIDDDNDIDLIIGGSLGGIIYFFENIQSINIDLKLINGDGNDGKTIYSKYKSYCFQINASNNNGYIDLDKVILTLDYPKNNLSYCWSQPANLFTKFNDPNNFTILTSGYSKSDGISNWTIYFNISFDWSYHCEEFQNVKIYSTGQKAKPNSILISDFYHVENDLELIGNLSVVGEYQGNLSGNDWIKGNEKITWSRLKVIYENSTNICPPDNEFNVTLSDTHGNYWNDTSSSGENISIISAANNQTDPNEIYKLNITGIPPYCDKSNIIFPLKIDADNITFTNPKPASDIWHTSPNINCGITVNDIGGSFVNGSSIEYCISNNNGTNWDNWVSAQNIEVAESINCMVNVDFEDGYDNHIRWRGKDMAGNGYSVSDSIKILVDTTNVIFQNPTPTSSETFSDVNVTCSISILDETSGVNASTIEYSILKHGETEWSVWTSTGEIINTKSINCLIAPMFNNGTENYIKWRAKDVAGNGYNKSDAYQIKIDTSKPSPKVKLIYPMDRSIISTVNPRLQWELIYSNANQITYNVILNNSENPETIVSQEQTETYFLTDTLTDDTTYYWTVIPVLDGIPGYCMSGTWNFTINTSHIPYFGLELWAERNSIPIKQGRSGIVNFTVKNTGDSEDTIIFYFNAPELGNENINLNKTSFELFPDESAKIRLEINIPIEKEIGLYDGVVNATSLGALEYGQVVYSVEGLLINVLKSSISYGVNITIEKPKIEIKQGETDSMKLYVKNIGSVDDIFEIKLISEEFSVSNIDIINNISIKTGKNEIVIMNITVPKDQAIKHYNILVIIISQSAQNINQNKSDFKVLELVVLEGEKDRFLEESSLFLWMIALIIIVVIIIVILFLYLKKKKKPLVEAEIKEDKLISKEIEVQEPLQEPSEQQSQPSSLKNGTENAITQESLPLTDMPKMAPIIAEPKIIEEQNNYVEIEE